MMTQMFVNINIYIYIYILYLVVGNIFANKIFDGYL